jgi:hypothetical protein
VRPSFSRTHVRGRVVTLLRTLRSVRVAGAGRAHSRDHMACTSTRWKRDGGVRGWQGGAVPDTFAMVGKFNVRKWR